MSEFLKCDAPDCDHFEATPVMIDIVDKPCPKCGANLCTKSDFILFQSVKATSDAVQQIHLRENPGSPLQLVATNIHDGVISLASDVVHGINPFPNKPVKS